MSAPRALIEMGAMKFRRHPAHSPSVGNSSGIAQGICLVDGSWLSSSGAVEKILDVAAEKPNVFRRDDEPVMDRRNQRAVEEVSFILRLLFMERPTGAYQQDSQTL